MGFLFFVMVAGLVVFFWLKSSKTSQEQWQVAADQLNLAYYGGGLGSAGTISGSIDGHRITVSTFTKRSGNNSQTFTKYHIEYRQRLKTDMKMTKQGALHNLGKIFGLQDINVGNPAFDDRVLLRGSNPEAVRRVLTPELRDAVKLAIVSYDDCVITNEHICVNRRGRDSDAAVVVGTVRRLLKFCELMNASHNYTPKNTQVLDRHPAAVPPIPKAKEPPKIPVSEDPLPEIEAIEPSFDPYTTPRPIVPDPPMIPVDDEPDPVPAVPVAEDVPPPVSEPEPDVLDLKQTAEALFRAEDSGSALLASKVFDEKYKGRRIAGSGTVKRVGKISYDPVFGSIRGIKVALTVCEMDGAYSKIKVSAETIFPLDEFEKLKSLEDKPLHISGKLIAQDTMMRKLFVVDE
ncbi:hypothetical protein [Pontiella sp.]|uniref:hypothetical protein n=1 Tax=Pontiella sp. TaxID=2837462 RepID=UPI003562F45B